MRTRQVRLTIRPPHFVGSDDDLDREPEARSLVLSAVAFRNAVGLAELKGFRAPQRHYLPGQTAAFARALAEAMAAEVDPARGRGTSARFSALGQLREFFAPPAQARVLKKLLAFVAGGGLMDVSEE